VSELFNFFDYLVMSVINMTFILKKLHRPTCASPGFGSRVIMPYADNNANI